VYKRQALKHNVFKIMTHPEMSETLLHRCVMLSVMGMLHPLGGVIAIGVGYLCAHLVHTAFKFLNNHKDTVQEVMQLPVLKTIYNATGIKEWAEARDEAVADQRAMDPLEDEFQLQEGEHSSAAQSATLEKTPAQLMRAEPAQRTLTNLDWQGKQQPVRMKIAIGSAS